MEMITVHNVEIGEITQREITQQELQQLAIDAAQAEAMEIVKAEKEASRQALLNKLGITAEEAKLLLA